MNRPDPANVWRNVLEWLGGAARDQRAAKICLMADPAPRDIAAYHCQQAMEKLLKGILVRANTDVGKAQDLCQFGQSVLTMVPSAAPMVMPARAWSTWSVDYRYPGETAPVPTTEEPTSALDLIVRLGDVLRSLGRLSDLNQSPQGD